MQTDRRTFRVNIFLRALQHNIGLLSIEDRQTNHDAQQSAASSRSGAMRPARLVRWVMRRTGVVRRRARRSSLPLHASKAAAAATAETIAVNGTQVGLQLWCDSRHAAARSSAFAAAAGFLTDSCGKEQYKAAIRRRFILYGRATRIRRVDAAACCYKCLT